MHTFTHLKSSEKSRESVPGVLADNKFNELHPNDPKQIGRMETHWYKRAKVLVDILINMNLS